MAISPPAITSLLRPFCPSDGNGEGVILTLFYAPLATPAGTFRGVPDAPGRVCMVSHALLLPLQHRAARRMVRCG